MLPPTHLSNFSPPHCTPLLPACKLPALSNNYCLTLLVCSSAGPYHVFALLWLLTASWHRTHGPPPFSPVAYPSCSPRRNVLQCPKHTLQNTHTHTYTPRSAPSPEKSHCQEPCSCAAQLCVPHGHVEFVHISKSPALHHDAQTAPYPSGTAFHKLWT